MKRTTSATALAAAAMMVLALGVTSSAFGSETRLCKMKSCHEGGVYASGEKFEASLNAGGDVRMEQALGVVGSCSQFKLGGEYTKDPGEPALAKITSMYLGECGSGCAMQAVNLPYQAELTATGSGNGTIRIKKGSSESGDPGFKITGKCLWIEPGCIAKAEKIEGTIHGGQSTGLDISKATFFTGSGCISNMTLSTEPSTGRLAVCEISSCSSVIPNGYILGALGSTTFNGGFGATTTCESLLGGKFTETVAAAGGNVRGEITIAEWSNCSDKCTATAQELPWQFQIESDGSMWLEKEGAGKVKIKFANCATGINKLFNGCAWSAGETRPGGPSEEGVKLTIAEGSPASASSSAKLQPFCGPLTMNSSSALAPESFWIGAVNPAMGLSPGALYLE